MHYDSAVATVRRPQRPVVPSQLCAELLGSHIRTFRLRDRRSLEELIHQTGLTVEEWMQIERGELPLAWEMVLMLGMVFNLGSSWMKHFQKLWRKAWPQ
jgi:hypothetical protein